MGRVPAEDWVTCAVASVAEGWATCVAASIAEDWIICVSGSIAEGWVTCAAASIVCTMTEKEWEKEWGTGWCKTKLSLNLNCVVLLTANPFMDKKTKVE